MERFSGNIVNESGGDMFGKTITILGWHSKKIQMILRVSFNIRFSNLLINGANLNIFDPIQVLSYRI